MKSLKGLLLVGAASAVPMLFAASAATAAPTTVKAVTHLSDRPDTCACVTNTTSPNGYVWAYDNLSRQFTVTANGNNDYTVVAADNGSFSAFAEPNNTSDPSTFHPISADGSLKGTITYDVSATQGPDPSALPSQIPSDVSTSDMITHDLFHGGNATIISSGGYSYNYHAGADTYTQTTTTITGDITGK